MHICRGPIVCLLLSLSVLASHAHLVAGQAPAPAPAKPVTDPKAAPPTDPPDPVVLAQAIDATIAGQPAASGVPLTWASEHFIKSLGDAVYVPFTVKVDRSQLNSASAVLVVRAVSKSATAAPPATPAPPAAAPAAAARPVYPWEQSYAVDVPADGNVSRAMAVPAGTYDVFVAIKETSSTPSAPGAPKIGVLRHELTVPPFSGPDFTTSSVLLLRDAEQLAAPLPADKQQDNPYVFNVLKVTPSIDGVFPVSGELEVMFWIYGAAHTGGKPDVQIEYSFHQRQPDGSSKYFNRTAPQRMNAESLPPEFNLTAGHQLLSSLKIPLKSFPVGNYRLEIKVTDLPSGKNLTNNVNFSVSAS